MSPSGGKVDERSGVLAGDRARVAFVHVRQVKSKPRVRVVTEKVTIVQNSRDSPHIRRTAPVTATFLPFVLSFLLLLSQYNIV